jgi:hypothetical protein
MEGSASAGTWRGGRSPAGGGRRARRLGFPQGGGAPVQGGGALRSRPRARRARGPGLAFIGAWQATHARHLPMRGAAAAMALPGRWALAGLAAGLERVGSGHGLGPIR